MFMRGPIATSAAQWPAPSLTLNLGAVLHAALVELNVLHLLEAVLLQQRVAGVLELGDGADGAAEGADGGARGRAKEAVAAAAVRVGEAVGTVSTRSSSPNRVYGIMMFDDE